MFSQLLAQKYANDREAKLPRYGWRTSSTLRKAAQKRSGGNSKCEMIRHKGPPKLSEELIVHFVTGPSLEALCLYILKGDWRAKFLVTYLHAFNHWAPNLSNLKLGGS